MLVLLEKVFGCKFEDELGNSRKLHKEERHNMCITYVLGFKIKETEIVTLVRHL